MKQKYIYISSHRLALGDGSDSFPLKKKKKKSCVSGTSNKRGS